MVAWLLGRWGLFGVDKLDSGAEFENVGAGRSTSSVLLLKHDTSKRATEARTR